MRILRFLTLALALHTSTPGHAVPALTAPPGLSADGRKLWATLVDGRPQWSNWLDLMRQDPADNYLYEEFYTIIDHIDRQLGPESRRLYLAANSMIYRILTSSPQFKALNIDLSNPAQEIRESFARLILRAEQPRPMSLVDAQRRAECEVRERDGVAAAAPLDQRQRFEINARAWRYANQEQPRRDFVTRRQFEEWKQQASADNDARQKRDDETIARAALADQFTYDHVTYVRFADQGVGTFKRFSDIYAFGAPLTLLNASKLSPKQQRAAELFDKKRFDPPKQYLREYAMLYCVHPRLGLLGLFLDDRKVSRAGDPLALYDRERMTHQYLLKVAAMSVESRWHYVFYLLKFDYAGRNTQAALEDAIARTDAKSDFFADDSSDWARKLYTNPGLSDTASYAADHLPSSRKRLHAWQVMARGLDFWNHRALGAQGTQLPRIAVQPYWGVDDYYHNDQEDPDLKYREEWRAQRLITGVVDPDASLGASETARGNHWVGDVNAKHDIFRIDGHHPGPIARWRIPSAQTLSVMDQAMVSSQPVSLLLSNLRTLNRPALRADDGHYLLPISTPEGFQPTSNQSVIEIKRGGRRERVESAHLTWRSDGRRGLYAIDLGPRPITEATHLQIGFTPDLLRPRTSERLTVTAEQLEPVVHYLRTIGATALADQLQPLGQASAADLAGRLASAGVYSCADRPLGRRGLIKFVNQDGMFQVQCHMAAVILRELLQIALVHHPWRNRVRLELVISTPARREDAAYVLTKPLHAELDVIIDGEISETLDATPSSFEEFVNQTRASGSSFAERREILRTAIADFDVVLANVRARISDNSIPVFQIRRAGALALRRDELDEMEYGSKVQEILGAAAGSGEDLPVLRDQLHAWLDKLNQMVSFVKSSPNETDPAARRAGAQLLLQTSVVRAAARVVEATAEYLDVSCERKLTER